MRKLVTAHVSVQCLVLSETIMAKSAPKASTGPARFRLVILEAESPDGDLTPVLQAAQNALRPAENSVPIRRAIAAQTKVRVTPDAADVANEEDDAALEPDQVEDEEDLPSASRSRSASKPRSPKVINADLKSGDMPFSVYAEQTKPKSHAMKNLVVAAWFKKYRGLDEITMDHVYTCYLTVKWSSGMKDFSKTLRNLKQRNLMESNGEGSYSINHVGLNEVSKIGG